MLKSIGGIRVIFKEMLMYRYGLVLSTVLMLAMFAPRADAIGTFNPTEAELALLPPYCLSRAYQWGTDHPEVRRWRAVFGEDYIHMHHYCQGLLYLMRGDISPLDSHEAHFNYKKAVGNLEYMEDRASPGFSLMPELYLKKGQALSRMGESREAVAAFRKSIKLKPDYVPAYAVFSDFFLMRGQNGKARQVLREGLSAVPDAGILQRRLAEISQDKSNETTQAVEQTPVPSEPAAAGLPAAPDGNATE